MQEFDAVRREFDLHALAVDDAVRAHQRPKLEVYGDTLFLVIKTVRYVGSEELVDIGEVHGLRRARLPDHRPPRRGRWARQRAGAAGAQPELLAMGPGAALHAIVDRIVDAYEPVVDGVLEDIEEVETEVFSPRRTNPVERIYRLRREVLEFARAARPAPPALRELTLAGVPNIDPQLTPYFRDVADHAARVGDQIEGFGTLLAGALQANLTQVSVRQNEDMRRISAWVAIIAVPTAVAGIYGMNFEHMPELGWRYGYPAVLLLIAAICLGLYARFRRVGWL